MLSSSSFYVKWVDIGDVLGFFYAGVVGVVAIVRMVWRIICFERDGGW
jgi:uncharacterized iron-regulated membrane protein